MNNTSARPLPLDQLGGEWIPMSKWQVVPALANLYGCVSASPNATGLCHTHFHPVYLGHIGDKPVLELELNGQPVSANALRWLPFELERRAETDIWRIHSAVRVPANAPGALLTVEITNGGAAAAALDASLDVRVPARSFRGEIVGFVPPIVRLPDANAHTLSWFENFAVTEDTLSQGIASLAATPDADALEGSRWHWRRMLAPGETLVLRLCVAIGEDLGRCFNVRTWCDAFERAWDECRTGLEARWRDVFTPANRRYAGHLPLPPTDDPALVRTYYMGVLDLLMNERLDLHPTRYRSFILSFPNRGAATQYPWEAGLCADIWARLDEPSLRGYLLDTLRVNWRHTNAFDFHTGEGIGDWYTVNAWSIWLMARACLRFAKDGYALLDVIVNRRTVGDHLEEIAWSWRERLDESSGLMHCGDKWNMLECVHGYEHMVASYNAAAVAIMRGVADVLDQWRGSGAGNLLREAALAQVPKVLSLYASDGWWACLRDGGERRVVRHLYDQITVSRCLGDDLPSHIAGDMMAAIRRELFSGNWMLAMSPHDPEAVARAAAGEAPRYDHTWTGSYSAWVAQAAELFIRHGAREEGEAILRRAAKVTRQGPFGAAVAAGFGSGEETKTGIFSSLSGAAFSQAMIETLWGANPP
ncbi:MAG: hypothetical protein WC076_02040 [Terrimicrobiaceae bacterium]|nr:hypothetical protein [Terrimicrobiaceae bacterium]